MNYKYVVFILLFGWNSWDCYGVVVMEDEICGNVEYMVEYFKFFGWNYIIVDI